MQTILNIAKELLKENKQASLTGTLMLRLRGVDLGRDPGDIDILINDYAKNFNFPKGLEYEENGEASDGTAARFRYKGFKVDVMSSNEKPTLVNGINLASVTGLMLAKHAYSHQDSSSADKHREDLYKLGFIFPELRLYPTDEDDNLPF